MRPRSIRFRLTVWYAGLLAGMLALFGASIYVGLGKYLLGTLEQSLSKQARQIGETFLASVELSGEDYVIDEIREHYAPELNGRFVRVTRSDGSVMYVSGRPEDNSFDPSGLPAADASTNKALTRSSHLGDGRELLIHALPFEAERGERFLIEVGAPYARIKDTLRGLLLTLAVAFPVCVAAAMGGGFLIIRRALAPLDEMTRTAERITSRNLNERLPVTDTGDEVERLSVSLNQMIARLDHSFRHISRFSADASHELRTPLTILRGELEGMIERQSLSDETRETVASALEEVERLTRVVESLLAISRLDAGEARMERTRIDLAELASTTAEQMRLLAEDKNISLRCDANEKVEVEGDLARLKQVIVNLLDNAIKYTPEGGAVHLSVAANGTCAAIEVSDNGPGIPEDALPRVFERFYRVDRARSRQMGGAGLGLSIVNSISAAHGGRVEAHSIEGGGSRFRVELPLADSQLEG